MSELYNEFQNEEDSYVYANTYNNKRDIEKLLLSTKFIYEALTESKLLGLTKHWIMNDHLDDLSHYSEKIIPVNINYKALVFLKDFFFYFIKKITWKFF